jgi:hypothetical protein
MSWDDLRLHVCNKPNCGTTCKSSCTAAQLSLIRTSALPPHCLRMRGILYRNHMINVPPIVQSQTAQCPIFFFFSFFFESSLAAGEPARIVQHPVTTYPSTVIIPELWLTWRNYSTMTSPDETFQSTCNIATRDASDWSSLLHRNLNAWPMISERTRLQRPS